MSKKPPKPHQSPYTADRNIPGAFEGETVTRRRLMTGLANGGGAVAVGMIVLPAIGFAASPIFEKVPVRWEGIGLVTEFSPDTYVGRTLTITPGAGETGKTTVYMRARNELIDKAQPADEYNKFVAMSSRCMHLGCPVRFVAPANRFICPCHGGVYDFTGMVQGGPPVRPLDRFYTRVVGDVVEVGPRYSVNDEFKRFSPRDPGSALDGIGQYLFPSRPSIRKLPGT